MKRSNFFVFIIKIESDDISQEIQNNDSNFTKIIKWLNPIKRSISIVLTIANDSNYKAYHWYNHIFKI